MWVKNVDPEKNSDLNPIILLHVNNNHYLSIQQLTITDDETLECKYETTIQVNQSQLPRSEANKNEENTEIVAVNSFKKNENDSKQDLIQNLEEFTPITTPFSWQSLEDMSPGFISQLLNTNSSNSPPPNENNEIDSSINLLSSETEKENILKTNEINFNNDMNQNLLLNNAKSSSGKTISSTTIVSLSKGETITKGQQYAGYSVSSALGSERPRGHVGV